MFRSWPRVPQHATVKQPIMPNDRLAYQRCQDALATMPRISIPEAMGNDRGPAAEGVAHKITTSEVMLWSWPNNKIVKIMDLERTL